MGVLIANREGSKQTGGGNELMGMCGRAPGNFLARIQGALLGTSS